MLATRVEIHAGPLQIRLQRAYDATVTAGSLLHGYVDDVDVAWYLRRGGVTVRHAGGTLVAEAGSWVLLPAWLRRDQRFAPGSAQVSVRFRVVHAQSGPLFAEGLPLVIPAAAVPRVAPGLLPAAEQLVFAEAHADGDGVAGICRRQAALLAFVAAWHDSAVAAGCRVAGVATLDPRLAAARAVLSAHGRIRPVPYQRLAQATGMSRVHLDRLFSAAFGVSPAGWLDRRVLERTTAALAGGGQPIKALAREFGFTDDAHFARWFRRHTGRSPSQARESGA
jgi:AraC-like DNA-binding protein